MKLRAKTGSTRLSREKEREEARRLFRSQLSGSLRHVHSEHSVVLDGARVRVEFHNILASDGEGNTIGVLSSAEDVTERRRKEKTSKEVENRLQVSLDFMIEGYQIIDPDWRYVYLNESAARQGKKKREELRAHDDAGLPRHRPNRNVQPP